MPSKFEDAFLTILVESTTRLPNQETAARIELSQIRQAFYLFSESRGWLPLKFFFLLMDIFYQAFQNIGDCCQIRDMMRCNWRENLILYLERHKQIHFEVLYATFQEVDIILYLFRGQMDSRTSTKNHPFSQSTTVNNPSDDNFIEVLKTKDSLAALQNTMNKLNLSSQIRDYFCQCILDRKKNKQFVDDIANKLKIIGTAHSQIILDKLNKIIDQNNKSVERSKMTEFLKLIVQGQFKKASQKCIEYFDFEPQIKKCLKEMQNAYESSKKLFELVFTETSKYKVNDSNLKFENQAQSLEAIYHQLTFRYDQLGQFVEAFEKQESIMERVKYPPNPKFGTKLNLWVHALYSINKQIKSYEIVKESYQNIMTQYYSTKKIDKSKIQFDIQQWQTELKNFEKVIVAMISDNRLKGSPSKALINYPQSKITDMQKQNEEYQKKIVQCSDIIASQNKQLAILKSNQHSKQPGYKLEKQSLLKGKNGTNQIESSKQLNQLKNEIQFWKNKKQALDKELENIKKELTNQKECLKKIEEDSKTKTNNNAALEKEKKKIQGELTAANQKVIIVQQTNQQLNSEITNLEEDIKDLLQENQRLKMQLDEYEKQGNESNTAMAEKMGIKQIEISRLKTENASWEQQFENRERQLMSQISGLKSFLVDRDAKITSLQNLHQKAKFNSESQQISELKIQLKNERQNLAQEKKNQIQMMEDNQKLQKQVSKLEEEAVQNKQCFEKTLTQIECQRQKEAQNHSTEKQIFQNSLKSVQKQKDELSQQVFTLQSTNEYLREKMEEDSRTKQQVSDTRNKLSKVIEELQTQLQAKQEKEDDLEQQLQAAKEAIQFVNNENQKLTKALQEKQTLITSLERSVVQKESILSQKEVLYQKQEQKLQQLHQSLLEGEQTQRKLREEYEGSIAEIKQECQRHLQVKDDKIDQMGQQIEKLTELHKEQITNLRKQMIKIQTQKDEVFEKFQKLSKEVKYSQTIWEEQKEKLIKQLKQEEKQKENICKKLQLSEKVQKEKLERAEYYLNQLYFSLELQKGNVQKNNEFEGSNSQEQISSLNSQRKSTSKYSLLSQQSLTDQAGRLKEEIQELQKEHKQCSYSYHLLWQDIKKEKQNQLGTKPGKENKEEKDKAKGESKLQELNKQEKMQRKDIDTKAEVIKQKKMELEELLKAIEEKKTEMLKKSQQ